MQTNNDGKQVKLSDEHYIFDGVVYAINRGAGLQGHKLFEMLADTASSVEFLSVAQEHAVVFPGATGRIISAVLNNGTYQYVVSFDEAPVPVPVDGKFLSEV